MRIALLVLGAGLLLGAACAGPVDGPWDDRMGGPMDDHMGRGGTTTEEEVAPDARRIEVTMTNLAFAPSEIRIAAGEEVELVVHNDSSIYHDLTIDALGVRIGVEAGDTGSGVVRADEPGAYRFICSVPGHAGAGMEGTLTVEAG